MLRGGRAEIRRFCGGFCLPKDQAERALKEAGVPRSPYCDPLLRQPRRYEQLLRMMDEKCMLEFALDVTEQCGLFAVKKKNNRQRLIIDARRSNRWFAAPPKTRLVSGDAFSRLTAVGGHALELGQTDIQDAFYQLALPQELRHLFGLPRVRAGRVGVSRTVDGAIVAADTWIYPRLKVVAMGWTHALHLCQMVLETVTERTGFLNKGNRVVDKSRVPMMEPVVHPEYVGNFVAFSQTTGAAAGAADAVARELRRGGLRAHPAETSPGGEALGWFFSRDEPLMSAKPRRLWRVRLAFLCAQWGGRPAAVARWRS